MNYFSIIRLTSEEMKEVQMFCFSELQAEAIKYLKRTKQEVSSENITRVQTEISIKKKEVPPHWTGWCRCSNCKTVPAPKGALGDEVESCAWCDSREPDGSTLLDLQWFGHCNMMDYEAEQAVKRLKLKGDWNNDDIEFSEHDFSI